MSSYIDVWPCGTPVRMKAGQQQGYITGISIRGVTPLYEITYHHNGEYRNISLANDFEFDTAETHEKKQVGFLKN